MVAGLSQQVAGPGDEVELALSGDHAHDLAGHRRQELVGVAVHEEQGSVEQLGDLAPGGLGGQADDARCVATEGHAGVDRHRPPEAVAHHDEAPGPDPPGDVGRGGHVHHAAVEVVRTAVADPDGADALLGERLAQIVEQSVGRAEQAAHGPAAHEHHVVGVPGAVPQQRDQAFHRVHLDVVERRGDRLLLHGDHSQRIERWLRLGVGHRRR
ncbi:MAG: hypothetical protein ACXV8G_14445 [Acidimicrobiales bacterium]